MEDPTVSNTNINAAHHLECKSRMKVRKANTESSIFELMDDIFLASETAINILNDLLHYEQIDAGINISFDFPY